MEAAYDARLSIAARYPVVRLTHRLQELLVRLRARPELAARLVTLQEISEILPQILVRQVLRQLGVDPRGK
ncbi:hypothetical protein ACFVJH_04755 [Streptomyces decoyicus]|uniref:hypothetical protein n=1 Tax=Streptomyces decoyicus TaxID=249567 RepID=UPI003643E267